MSMSASPRLAIVTGFKPFGSYHDNPTRRITERLSGARLGHVLVEGIVLPNEYDTHHTVMQFISDSQRKHGISRELPVAVVSGGLSTSIHKISLEAVGWNEINSKYATDSGVLISDGRPIEKGAPEGYRTNADLVDVSLALQRAGVPATVSTDAGRFSCNSILFGMLHLVAQTMAPVVVVYYHSAFTAEDKGKIVLPPEKIFMPSEWLENGVPAMVLEAARQAEDMHLRGGVRVPAAQSKLEKIEPSHKDSL
jgi:pyroglutamyl-peptidase